MSCMYLKLPSGVLLTFTGATMPLWRVRPNCEILLFIGLELPQTAVIKGRSQRGREKAERTDVPRFFFSIRGPDGTLSDDILGLAFPDFETACAKACDAAPDLEDEFAARNEDPRGYSVEVVNTSGELVFTLPFSSVFAPHEGDASIPVNPSKARHLS
jgi:hypothetical protein